MKQTSSPTALCLDLKTQIQSMEPGIDQANQSVVSSSPFAGGPFVERSRLESVDYSQTRLAVRVCSQTVAVGWFPG